MSVTFFSTEAHYAHHLWPVFQVMDGARWFHNGEPELLAEYVKDQTVVVAAHSDLLVAHKAGARKVVLMQHGAGQSYLSGAKKYQHSSYPGGRGHERAALALFPNQQSYVHHRQRYGDRVPAEVVGCPKLDAWVAEPPKPRSDPPMVVISFHWRCKVAREAGGVWDDYGLAAIEALWWMEEAGEITLGVHAHPRIAEEVRESLHGKIPVGRFLHSFHEVRDVADLYVCDNSSTMFEFAALDRPVVVMNSPRWRRNVHHGLRYWDCEGLGVQIGNVDDLHSGVLRALEDGPLFAETRREVVSEVYPYLGSASQRAAAAIERLERS